MTSRKTDNQLALILTGFLVLAIPLAFFNHLLQAALERTRAASLGLLREEILQTAEQIRTQMKPATYVKDTVRAIHRKLLPEIVPGIVKMRPDMDFGKEQFSASLPDRLLKELRSRGLDAIQIIVTPPSFTGVFYWNSDELRNQCKVEEKLAQDQLVGMHYTSARLYQQNYQKQWPWHNRIPVYLLESMSINKSEYIFAYLSRFSEIYSSHDQVNEYFTDYFGQQSLFCYSYHCISPVNLHGAYMVIVPQISIQPNKVVKAALSQKKPNIKVSIVDLTKSEDGFLEKGEQLEYYTRPPSDFWSHYFFMTGDRSQAQKSRAGGWHVKITGRLPGNLLQLQKRIQIFRMAAVFILMGYFAAAIRFRLLGFNTRLSIRNKLAAILGLIILIPIAGTGTLTWISLNGSDRLIENHLLQRTLNNIKELAVINDENLLKQMVAVLEIKRRLSDLDQLIPDLRQAISLTIKDTWFSTWTTGFSTIWETGLILNFGTWCELTKENRLVVSLLGKYMDSLGLIKIGKDKRSADFSRTMTLGLMENYITPGMEEAYVVHESTIQRELTHSSDTSRASLYLVRNRSGQYQLVYHRITNGDEHVHRYLTWYSQNLPGWFTRTGKFGDVSLGVRIRKYFDLNMFAWPTESLLSEEMTGIFERAISTRDFGHGIIRKDGDIEVRAWRFKEGESAVIAAMGKSKGTGIAGLATFMIFPVLLGYAVLVLYFITTIISAFVSEPVKIINSGVVALHEERYGVLIAGFSGDEFKKMTQAFNEMSNALRQREMMKRYVSGKLLQEVQSGGQTTKSQTGQLVKVTALASDIRGFTAISEKFTPAEVVEMLNSYFTLMEGEISSNGGIIDKYIGDAVQALFYHDNAGDDNAALRACRAAVGMRCKLDEFNAERRRQGLFTVENGIGIDTGMVISGSIGSESGRKDYTVVGNILEQAANLEARTAGCNSRILLSDNTHAEVKEFVVTKDFDGEAVELANV